MGPPALLVLDQATRSCNALVAKLEAAGYDVLRTESLAEAEALDPGRFEAVLAERALGGDRLAARWAGLPEAPQFLLFDAFSTRAERADGALPGVTELLPRPLPDARVLEAVARAVDTGRLRRERRGLDPRADDAERFGALTSRDPGMQRIFSTLRTVADSNATILVRGESGTGKTELARAVHADSNRAGRPFVAVNCGALPETLLASELFGHVRGAFTGAVADRTGKFEAADRGTLFLDEVGTAPMDLQVKLLRVLEEGRFERVGESVTREADVRVVAATNEDLERAVEERRFRMDLFYRLNVVAVEVPPLRDRPDDVLLLAERFLARFAARHARPLHGFAPGALARLVEHDWPGNVRELQNTVERAVLLSTGELLTADGLWPGSAPDEAERPEAPPWTLDGDVSLREVVEASERWWIQRALEAEDGSRQRTARRLGINRTTLFNKMRKYDLLSFPTDGSEAPATDLDRSSLDQAG